MTTELEEIAACYPQGKEHASIILPQLQHRLNLASAWGIAAGSTVLDIGCGQGDSVVCLAHAVGPEGHVVGIDPGPPDYGAPLTLAQAQDYIRRSALGGRITFLRADAPTFLRTHTGPPSAFDVGVLCHSLWYFDTAEDVGALFAALATAPLPARPKRLCIAEWTGDARTEAQRPHELAARVQRMLHSAEALDRTDEDSAPNIRSALSPDQVVDLAQDAGFRVVSRGTLEAAEGMMDGSWEVSAALSTGFLEEVQKLNDPEREAIVGLIDELRSASERVKSAGDKVRSMDVAWVVLEQ
jgi:SAM-dependent methyltransferase